MEHSNSMQIPSGNSFSTSAPVRHMKARLAGISRKVIALIFLSVCAINSNASDCAKKKTYAEKEICRDPFLTALDVALKENYDWMMASDIGEGAEKDLAKTQKKWIQSRNKCVDRECITSLYKSRIVEVCEYPVIQGVHAICNQFSHVEMKFPNWTK
ncbi:uncharacterized protein ABIC71_003036 [Herbaspirillum seropedicae]|uniref:lysozyme inhibitor LprI family protein n=1 Tax=Herbaspirillum seropedicae TaxID=964 RepID=UPI0033941E3A